MLHSCLLLLVHSTGSLAQVIDQEIRTVPTQIGDLSGTTGLDYKGTNFIAVPIPISNPTLGNGLAVTVGAIFQISKGSRPSFVGIGAARLDSDSWGVGLAQSTSFAKDRYRVDATIGLGEVNYEFFGIGNEAADRGRSLTLDQRVWGGKGRFLTRVSPNLYVGAQLWYYDINTTFPLTKLIDLFPNLKPLEFQMRNAGIGAVINYDSRKNRFKPNAGMLAGLEANFGRTDLGHKFDFSADYQKGLVFANRYVGLSEKGTLAMRASLCRVGGQAPFFDICLFGMNNDLRGYLGGQYRDRAMFTVQVEYRRDLTRRLGATVFGGVGSVAPDFGSFRSDNMLPAVGVGLRLLVAEDYGTNVSVDFAFGKGSDAVYFRIGEAF